MRMRSAATALATLLFMANFSARMEMWLAICTVQIASDMDNAQKKQKKYERIGEVSYGRSFSASAENAVKANPVISVACVM